MLGLHGLVGFLVLIAVVLLIINYKTKVSAWLLLGSTVVLNFLGWAIYPAFRTEVKPDLGHLNELAAKFFETKEHIAWFTIPLALVILAAAYNKNGEKTLRYATYIFGLILVVNIVLGYYITSVKSL